MKDDSFCEFPECGRLTYALGYCGPHYQQSWAGKDLKPIRATAKNSTLLRCSFDGCERAHASGGLCASHRAQERRGRPLTPIRSVQVRTDCSFPECPRPHSSSGYCAAHAMQNWRGEELRPLKVKAPCLVSGCPRYGLKNVLCDSHQSRALSYSLPPEKLAEMLSDAACEICGELDSGMHIDHDHACCPMGGSCGKCVRGVLCSRCNLAIGQMRDDVDLLMRAVNYLKAYRVA